MAGQKELTLLEFQKKFSSEEKCREHLFSIKWATGYKCPKCGHTEYGYVTTRHLYQCKKCGYQTSVTVGTVMHGTKTPLLKWFRAIFLVSHDICGVSAVRLQKELGVSYPTAWLILHKIRRTIDSHALGERGAKYQLGGIVEMGDS